MNDAVQIRTPATLDRLELVASEPRRPSFGEVQIRIRASSLNFHDYWVVTGAVPVRDKRIPMSDGAGEIVAIGDGVEEFAVGDSVVSHFFRDWIAGDPNPPILRAMHGDSVDGFATRFATVPTRAITRAPRGYSHEEAATLPCAGVTAWRALVTNGGLKSGDTVLIQGSGGVSIFALQIAKAAGATVIATSSSDEKLERLRNLGADHLINYRAVPEWGAAVLQLTGGRGVDHVVEIGGAGTLPQSITAVRLYGHIALIGVLTGTVGPVPTMLLMAKQVKLLGVAVGSHSHQLELIRAIETTGFRPVIDKTFPMEGLADAFRYQETGKHFGKICVSI